MFPNFDWPDGRPDVGPQPVFPDFDWPDGRPDVGPQPLPPDFDWPDGRPDVGPQPVFPGFNPRKPTAAKGGRVIAARTPDTCIDPDQKIPNNAATSRSVGISLPKKLPPEVPIDHPKCR